MHIIAANRQEDREAASAGQSSFCKLSGPLTLSAPPSATGPRQIDQSYWRRKSRYFPGRRSCQWPNPPKSDPLPVPVTRAWLVKGGHHEQWECNHTEQSIFSDTVVWGGGYRFHHQWHLKDTPQRCPDNSYEPACPPGCKVRVEWHLGFLSFLLQWVVQVDCGTAGCVWVHVCKSACVCASAGGFTLGYYHSILVDSKYTNLSMHVWI